MVERPVKNESAGLAGRVPKDNGFPHRPGWAEPEVVFRIIHVALDDGLSPTDGSPPRSYREQTVEIALGPNPTFQNGRVAALTRRVPAGQIVNAVPPSRRRRRPPRPPKPVGPPRIVETLRKAIEWRRQLDASEVCHWAGENRPLRGGSKPASCDSRSIPHATGSSQAPSD